MVPIFKLKLLVINKFTICATASKPELFLWQKCFICYIVKGGRIGVHCVVGDDSVMNPFSAPLLWDSLTETIIIIISNRYEALGGDSGEGLQIRMIHHLVYWTSSTFYNGRNIAICIIINVQCEYKEESVFLSHISALSCHPQHSLHILLPAPNFTLIR